MIPTPSSVDNKSDILVLVTLGHEFCGRVSIIPPETKATLQEGQAVMTDPRTCCKQCSRCATADSNLCSSRKLFGVSGHGGGGLWESIAVGPGVYHPIPGAIIPWAVLIEPLAVVRHDVDSIVPKGIDNSSKSALVLSGGPVGVGAIHGLRVAGVTKIFVSEQSAARRRQYSRFCAEAFNPPATTVSKACLEKTDGLGMDFVVNCAGVASAL